MVAALLSTVYAFSVFAQSSSLVVYSGTGGDTTALSPVVNAFRAVLGANNGNTPGPLSSGRREINWDGGGAAAPATTFPTPMLNFNTAPTTRGGVFTTGGTGFEISGQPSPLFGDINPTYPTTFTTFSSPRLFTALGSNVLNALFFVPGTNIPSTVSGFGAVFTDVDLPESTSVEYFDFRGNLLGKVFVPTANNGLSFVGAVANNARIARVRITSGNVAPSASANDGNAVDVVVMDDFIYGEPSTIGPPADADQCKNGGWREFNFPQSFKNQGDCIQFVNTGR
jgi:hypothetical protein